VTPLPPVGSTILWRTSTPAVLCHNARLNFG
jgi:hypothetical protein